MRSFFLAVLLSLFTAACGSECPTEVCEGQISSVEQALPYCPDYGCSEPDEPPGFAAPIGTYEGYATVTGYVGATTWGCPPLYPASRLFVRLVFTSTGPDDGTGAVVVSSNDPSDYSFSSTASNLGGSSPAEREYRTYSLGFSADQTTVSGALRYERNAEATYRTGCSGLVFSASYRKVN
jgi:hypothetical protein